jgi:hypothetical protein
MVAATMVKKPGKPEVVLPLISEFYPERRREGGTGL